MEKKLLGLLKRMAPTELLLLNTEKIEMMIMTVGLELIRLAFNVHARGIILGSADRLDHLLNMCRAAIASDVLKDLNEFAETQRNVVTVWNDNKKDKKDFLRSHMVHMEVIMKIGMGLNVIQKKNWNGNSMDGVKITEREIKRRLRMVIYNEDVETRFDEPVFNKNEGTFDLEVADDDYCDALNRPLLPMSKDKQRKLIIR